MQRKWQKLEHKHRHIPTPVVTAKGIITKFILLQLIYGEKASKRNQNIIRNRGNHNTVIWNDGRYSWMPIKWVEICALQWKNKIDVEKCNLQCQNMQWNCAARTMAKRFIFISYRIVCAITFSALLLFFIVRFSYTFLYVCLCNCALSNAQKKCENNNTQTNYNVQTNRNERGEKKKVLTEK